MLRYEWKKVFSKFKNRMTVLLLLVILIITSILTINRVEYVDGNGNHSSGISAARKLRAEKNKWEGYLTEEVFQEVVKTNAKIANSQAALSQDIDKQNKEYAKKQGFQGIADLINNAFSEWRDYNYYAIDTVSAEDAKQVYDKRISNLKEWLD